MHLLAQCDETSGCGKTYPADLNKCPHCGADSAFSSPAPLDTRDWIWDIETYPNCFTALFIHAQTGLEQLFEISDRRNDCDELIKFMLSLKNGGARGVGYNNIFFDYPVLHWIFRNQHCTVQDIYNKSQEIITCENKWDNVIWDRDQLFRQIDLFKIHHFDNKARSQSLKGLEIAMRMRNVVDLPFPVGTTLTDEQKDILIRYNRHDVKSTAMFYVRSLDKIHFREELGDKFINYADTKIGSAIFVRELEKAGVNCDGKTLRDEVALADCIPDYIKLETPEFSAILNRMKSVVLTRQQQDELVKTKGVFKDMITTLDNVEYKFGMGGIHSGVSDCIYKTSDSHVLSHRDVTSMYPSISIKNRYYPEHLDEIFCDVYEGVFIERQEAKSTGNGLTDKTLKLALNGAFGNMGSKHSPFCDHKSLLSITITGQLSMAMLVEQLLKVPGMTIVQTNTDGLILYHPKEHLGLVDNICQQWMDLTKLNLECENINAVYQRDVNNYMRVGSNGKIKRKGAYEYEYQYHQDPSMTVVAMAAEAALVHGKDISEFITSHRDPFDFMLRAKVPRGSKLVMRWPEWNVEQELQHITRYFVSKNGGQMVKISPPTEQAGTWKRRAKVSDDLYMQVMRENTGKDGDIDAAGVIWDERIHTKNKSKHGIRELSICAGYKVTDCADADNFDWFDLNYQWYIDEAEKLVTAAH